MTWTVLMGMYLIMVSELTLCNGLVLELFQAEILIVSSTGTTRMLMSLMSNILWGLSRACHTTKTTTWPIHDSLSILSFFSWDLCWIRAKTCAAVHLLLLLSELLMLRNSSLCYSFPCLWIAIKITCSFIESIYTKTKLTTVFKSQRIFNMVYHFY